MSIKTKNKVLHSKYKNTGLLFELSVRMATEDTINDRKSPAIDILQKYFKNTELLKEYLLYQSISSANNISEAKADILITSVLNSYSKLDLKAIQKSKYNLVKEIKEHYSEDQFFKTNVPTYRLNATIYTLFELINNPAITDPTQLIQVRSNLLEHVTKAPVNEVDQEWKSLDKGTKNLTFKIMVENFNSTFKSLAQNQKNIINEYIKCITSPNSMRKTLNTTLYEVKKDLIDQYKLTADPSTKAQLKEVINKITPFKQDGIIKESDVINTLQYCELLNELKTTNATS